MVIEKYIDCFLFILPPPSSGHKQINSSHCPSSLHKVHGFWFCDDFRRSSVTKVYHGRIGHLMLKIIQLPAHLTPHELHWNEILYRLTVAFLSIWRFVAKSLPDQKADPSDSFNHLSPEIILRIDCFLVITGGSKANHSTQRRPAIEAKFGKNRLLIIAIGILAGFNIT